jgi:hypothetical protein
MNSVLRALSVSEQGPAQMNNSDKACSIMEWNDDDQSSFTEIREILLEVDIEGRDLDGFRWRILFRRRLLARW